MPTWCTTGSFRKDYAGPSTTDKKRFRKAVADFVADLKAGKFRKGLRVKGIQGAEGMFEMTWAKDGRATFEYGPEIHPNTPHVIWRRCGNHSIFKNP